MPFWGPTGGGSGSSDHKVSINSADATPGYLEDKLSNLNFRFDGGKAKVVATSQDGTKKYDVGASNVGAIRLTQV